MAFETPLGLENADKLPDGSVRGRCPVCALDGRDRSGNHLRIYPSGRLHCAVDPDHWREAKRLLGLDGGPQERREFTPAEKREWARQKQEEERRLQARERARQSLPALVERWRWDEAEVWESSPIRPDGPGTDDPRLFLSALFPADAVVWTGETWQSGATHGAGRFRTVAEWAEASRDDVGPMVAPAIYPAGAVSRNHADVIEAPYVVLDFDERSREDSLAIVRWLREGMDWELVAMVWTGGKSVHAWFRHPGAECVDALAQNAGILGIDKSLIGAPEHPCRLPGQKHSKTGNLSTLLWLGR